MVRVSHKHLSNGGSSAPPIRGRAPGVGDGVGQPATSGGSSLFWLYVNIPTSTIALHTLAPLSFTFSEEKGDSPS